MGRRHPHDVAWESRGLLRALLRVGHREWRTRCYSCGAVGPWRPFPIDPFTPDPCPRLEVVK